MLQLTGFVHWQLKADSSIPPALHQLCNSAHSQLAGAHLRVHTSCCTPTSMRLQGFPNSTATEHFAEALFNRIPRTSGARLNAYQQQERVAAALSRQNNKYAMLSDDEDDEGQQPPAAPTTAALPAKKAKKGRQKLKVRGLARLRLMTYRSDLCWGWASWRIR